jgi:hypothetical protein
MNDITDLFHELGHSASGEPPASVVEADIERGHRALAQSRRRMRTRGAIVAATAIGAVAVVSLATGQFDSSGSSHPTAANGAPTTQPAPKPTATAAPSTNVLAVRLIAYTGKQLDGFVVDRVPEGWHLSGSTQYALTINAQGDTNDDPSVFVGKLTVLLQSQDASGLPSGQPVTVNGHAGVVTNDGGQALTYADGNGHTVVVQAPAPLAWSNAQLVSFAEGVHVTGNAIAGRG